MKLKVFLGAALLTLTSCFVAETESEEVDEPETEQVEEESESHEPEVDGGRYGCDLYKSTSGKGLVVPVLCSPFYLEKGRPPESQNKFDSRIELPNEEIKNPAN